MPVRYSKWGSEMTLTAAELIAELQKFPPDSPVITEGCDCYGSALTIRTLELGKDEEGPAQILIERDQ